MALLVVRDKLDGERGSLWNYWAKCALYTRLLKFPCDLNSSFKNGIIIPIIK